MDPYQPLLANFTASLLICSREGFVRGDRAVTKGVVVAVDVFVDRVLKVSAEP